MKTATLVGWGLAVIAFVVADAALWWASMTADLAVRPALVGAASAFGAAGVGVVSALAGSRFAYVYATRAAMTAERRLAYAQLLAFTREYGQANAALESCHAEVLTAQELADAKYDDQAELDKATNALDRANASQKAAIAGLNVQLDEYNAARARVELLGPKPVRSALELLSDSLLHEKSHAKEQDAFVHAARVDLGVAAE